MTGLEYLSYYGVSSKSFFWPNLMHKQSLAEKIYIINKYKEHDTHMKFIKQIV